MAKCSTISATTAAFDGVMSAYDQKWISVPDACAGLNDRAYESSRELI